MSTKASYEKHHFGDWKGAESPVATNQCTRCQVPVQMARVGGIKFLVDGKYVSKRPPCLPKKA